MASKPTNKPPVPGAVPAAPTTGFVITGKLYDYLNHFVRVVLPAIGTFYFATSELWGFPDGKEVVGTIAAINLLFGSLVHVSAQNFKNSDGDVDAYVAPETFAKEFPGQDKVTFKVDPSLAK